MSIIWGNDVRNSMIFRRVLLYIPLYRCSTTTFLRVVLATGLSSAKWWQSVNESRDAEPHQTGTRMTKTSEACCYLEQCGSDLAMVIALFQQS